MPLGARGAVSTHAPAWGATGRRRTAISRALRFNSRARVGRDVTVQPLAFNVISFNSRARVGRDVTVQPLAFNVISFNSRARVGRDQRPPPPPPPSRRFNSRARVGRDENCRDLMTLHLMFQLTRPRGARRGAYDDAKSASKSFNSRARVGRDNAMRTILRKS